MMQQAWDIAIAFLVCRARLQTWDKLEGGFGAESPGSAGPPGDSLAPVTLAQKLWAVD